MFLWGSLSPGSVLTSESLGFRSDLPSNPTSAGAQLAHTFAWAAERPLTCSPGARSQVQSCLAAPRPPPGFLNRLYVAQVGLDQQTVTLVCTNRRKQFLLDTADVALTE